MANICIEIINESSVLSDGEIAAALPAFQTQASRDFAPAWGIDADIKFLSKGIMPTAGCWQLAILDDSDQAGALGYHEATTEGLPLGKVFAKSDLAEGYVWTVTVSHELLEMLVDPELNLTVFIQQSTASGNLIAYEICDACEADQFGYKIGDTLVSNFVFPAWFESFRKKGSTQFDFCKHIDQPFQLLPGGYISVWDIHAGSGWQQVNSAATPATGSQRSTIGRRRARRVIPRDQWQHSHVRS
jgi:hypothetical protein